MEKGICTKPKGKNFNKPAYVIFMAAGIVSFCMKDFSEAFTFIGFAMIFDPFNTEVPFNKRPFYQRAWLFIHLLLTIALLVLMLVWK
jgi:hypothetical protein